MTAVEIIGKILIELQDDYITFQHLFQVLLRASLRTLDSPYL